MSAVCGSTIVVPATGRGKSPIFLDRRKVVGLPDIWFRLAGFSGHCLLSGSGRNVEQQWMAQYFTISIMAL